MSYPPIVTLEMDKLTDDAKQFGIDLFNRFPDLLRYAGMWHLDGRDAWSLVVKVPAPNGDPKSQMIIWVENGDDPSIGFASWHDHESLQSQYPVPGVERGIMLDMIDHIFTDRCVVCEDTAADGNRFGCLVDLTDPEDLIERLTYEKSSGEARLRSWTGKADRVVGLKDLSF